MAEKRLFMGVDGGGTKCQIRIRGQDGALLGEAEGGLANLYSDLDAAVATIIATITEALAKAGLKPEDRQHMH
ncbi:MAG: N-acetylglucosamine kinase, partial [Alphaproteobacteria bacterium]